MEDGPLRFVDMWNHFNSILEKLKCEPIKDNNEEVVYKEDLETIIVTCMNLLQYRVKHSGETILPWVDFSLLNKHSVYKHPCGKDLFYKHLLSSYGKLEDYLSEYVSGPPALETKVKQECKRDTRSKKANRSTKFAKETRCGILSYYEDKKMCLCPVMIRKNIDVQDYGHFFKMGTQNKLYLNLQAEIYLFGNIFEIEGRIEDHVPDEMIQYVLRNEKVRREFQDDRHAMFAKITEWLTSSQKIKWRQWSNEQWGSEYSDF